MRSDKYTNPVARFFQIVWLKHNAVDISTPINAAHTYKIPENSIMKL